MRQHKSATWWLVGLGALLLLAGVWLASLSMKRHLHGHTGHGGPWSGLVKHPK